MSTQIDEFDLGEVRLLLNQAFDAVEFDAFCLDYFPDVYNEFTTNMQISARMTLLFKKCRNSPKHWIDFLNSVQKRGIQIQRALNIEGYKKNKTKYNERINMENMESIHEYKLKFNLQKLHEWKTAHQDAQDLLGDIKTLIDFLSRYQTTLQLDVMLDAGSKWQRRTLPKLKKIQEKWNFRYAKAYEINKLKNEIITLDVITRRMMSGMDKEEVKELSQYFSQLHKSLWQLLEISDQEIINTVEALRPITQG